MDMSSQYTFSIVFIRLYSPSHSMSLSEASAPDYSIDAVSELTC